jgi:hypothetical protein
MFPSFFTNPAIFKFPLEFLKKCCSDILVASSANAYENTPNRNVGDNIRRRQITAPNNNGFTMLIFGSCFSFIYNKQLSLVLIFL